MMRKSVYLGAISLLICTACSTPEMTPNEVMALRQAQTRSYEVPFNTVFAATMSYLQDNNYQIRQAAKDAGLISAYKSKDLSGSAKFWGAFFAGAAAKKGDA